MKFLISFVFVLYAHAGTFLNNQILLANDSDSLVSRDNFNESQLDEPGGKPTRRKRRRGRAASSDEEMPWAGTKQKPPPKHWFGAQEKVLFIIAPCSAIFGVALAILLLSIEDSVKKLHDDAEVYDREPENLDEDVYGAGIATLVRDTYGMAEGKGDMALRISRFICSLLLMGLNIFLACWVILQLQLLVANRSVADIRKCYGKFEWFMYGENDDHIYLTPNGFPRGKKEHFDANNFDNLEFDVKEQACAIPFSQPQLLIPILFIWTLIVLGDLRRCGDLFVRLIFRTTTVDDMKDAIEVGEDGITETIVGLTKRVKGLLVVTCMIPRWYIDVYLLWLGCRWLCASQSFEDLLLNAVALEFVLLLKDILYACIQPDRNKRATQNTLIQPWQSQESASYGTFLSAFFLAFVALGWVLYYIYHFQAVLPDYKWDVAEVCSAHIRKMSSGLSPR